MSKKYKLVTTVFLLLLFVTQCRQKKEAGKLQNEIIQPLVQDTVAATKQIVLTTKFDSIIGQLKSRKGLSKNDMLSLKIIDTFYSNNSNEEIYCDTTVQLNDSIFYSILNLPGKDAICSHLFIATIDEINKKAIEAKYLKPDCDIDFSEDSYNMYEYKVLSKDKIKLIQNTVYQKKKRTSPNEEKNIDHKQIEIFYFHISASGQIVEAKT